MAEPSNVIVSGQWLVRSFAAEMERTGDKLDLSLIPYDRPTPVADVLPNGTLDEYVEVFDREMFRKQIEAEHPETLRKIRFLDGHPGGGGGSKLGWTLALRAGADWLHGTVQIMPTRIPDVEQMLADGIRDVSVGFMPLAGGTQIMKDGSRVRRRGHLDHIALEPQGAYPGAEVLAMRAQQEAELDEKLVRDAERFANDEIEAWLETGLEAEIEKQARYSSLARGIRG